MIFLIGVKEEAEVVEEEEGEGNKLLILLKINLGFIDGSLGSRKKPSTRTLGPMWLFNNGLVTSLWLIDARDNDEEEEKEDDAESRSIYALLNLDDDDEEDEDVDRCANGTEFMLSM